MVQRRLVEASSEKWRKLVLSRACAERERFDMGVHIEGTERGFDDGKLNSQITWWKLPSRH